MQRLSFTASPPDLTTLQEDENLRPAIDLINRWYAGADSFTFLSSGSTGSPKTVELSREFLIASAKRTIEWFGITSSDHLLLALNTSFMGGMMMIVRALVAQAELLYIAPNQLNENTLRSLPAIKLASFVPAQVSLLLQENKKDPFSTIKNVLLGGAPVSESLRHQIIELKSGGHFYHTYGMTETASHVAVRDLLNDKAIYHSLKGFEFSQDSRNCLIIHHLNNPVFEWVTNDVVELLSAHTFQWIGRFDWVINSGGIKYNLEKAEECVAAFFHKHHLPHSFTSYKLPDELWGEKWILIVTETLTQEQIDLLNDHCKTTLGKYCYPREIVFTKKIVYLSSGKVDRLNSYLQAITPSL